MESIVLVIISENLIYSCN